MTDERLSPRAAPAAIRELNWPLVLGLAALGALHPVFWIFILPALTTNASLVVVTVALQVLSVLVWAAWVAAVGFSRAPRPVLTLLCVGVISAVWAMLVDVWLGSVLDVGRPLTSLAASGPVADPAGFVLVLAVNALWGGICGGLAVGLRRARGVRDD